MNRHKSQSRTVTFEIGWFYFTSQKSEGHRKAKDKACQLISYDCLCLYVLWISSAKSFKPNTYVDRFRAQLQREWQRALAESWCYASHGYAQIHVKHLMYWKAISDVRRAMIRQILSTSIKRSLNIDLSIRYQWSSRHEVHKIPKTYQIKDRQRMAERQGGEAMNGMK